MKPNRAFIIRSEKSMPLLEDVNLNEDSAYWLFESGESFHGKEDAKFFYFRDVRIDSRLKLPLECVELEFSENENED